MKHLIRDKDKKSIRAIAYFSMEIGIKNSIPTYSGGLGVLAGDTLKAYADLVVPAVAVTLMCTNGYFRQELKNGEQIEHAEVWNPSKEMTLCDQKVVIQIEGRDVVVQAWEYKIVGCKGFYLPVYFLDTNLPENHIDDQKLTQNLYGGDQRYRIKQEAILGIAGVRMFDALGYKDIEKYHMNEGHSAFLTLELLRQNQNESESDPLKKYNLDPKRQRKDLIKNKCIFAGIDLEPFFPELKDHYLFCATETLSKQDIDTLAKEVQS